MTSIDFRQLLEEERKKHLFQTEKNLEETDQKNNSSSDSHYSNESFTKQIPLSDGKEIDLDLYAIEGPPNGIFYIPNYLTNSEVNQIIDCVYSAPENSWTQLKRRRLQNLGGTPHPSGMSKQELPYFLQQIGNKLVDSKIFHENPNHVLLNEYKPGQGIMAHQDGPLYFPLVAILSFGSACFMDFWDQVPSRESIPCKSLLIEPGSLLVFKEEAYNKFWHSIDDRTHDKITEEVINKSETYNLGDVVERKTRISLTIRIVLNISENEEIVSQNSKEEARRKEMFWKKAIDETQ